MGHRAAVNVVDFDDRYIVSASGDRTIKVSREGGERERGKEEELGYLCFILFSFRYGRPVIVSLFVRYMVTGVVLPVSSTEVIMLLVAPLIIPLGEKEMLLSMFVLLCLFYLWELFYLFKCYKVILPPPLLFTEYGMWSVARA